MKRFLAVILSFGLVLEPARSIASGIPSSSGLAAASAFNTQALNPVAGWMRRMLSFRFFRLEAAQLALSGRNSHRFTASEPAVPFVAQAHTDLKQRLPEALLKKALEEIEPFTREGESKEVYAAIYHLVTELVSYGRVGYAPHLPGNFRAEHFPGNSFFILVDQELREFLESGDEAAVTLLAAKLVHEAAEFLMESHPSVNWNLKERDPMLPATETVAYGLEFPILRRQPNMMETLAGLAKKDPNLALLAMYYAGIEDDANLSDVIPAFLSDLGIAGQVREGAIDMLQAHIASQKGISLAQLQKRVRALAGHGRSSASFKGDGPMRAGNGDETLTQRLGERLSKATITLSAHHRTEAPIEAAEIDPLLELIRHKLHLEESSDQPVPDLQEHLSDRYEHVQLLLENIDIEKATGVTDLQKSYEEALSALLDVVAGLLDLADAYRSYPAAERLKVLRFLARMLKLHNLMFWSMRANALVPGQPAEERLAIETVLSQAKRSITSYRELQDGGLEYSDVRYFRVYDSLGGEADLLPVKRSVSFTEGPESAARGSDHAWARYARTAVKIGENLKALREGRSEIRKIIKGVADEKAKADVFGAIRSVRAWTSRWGRGYKRTATTYLDAARDVLLEDSSREGNRAALGFLSRVSGTLTRGLKEISRHQEKFQERKIEARQLAESRMKWRLLVRKVLEEKPVGVTEYLDWIQRLKVLLNPPVLPFDTIPPGVEVALLRLRTIVGLLTFSRLSRVEINFAFIANRLTRFAKVLEVEGFRSEAEALGWAARVLKENPAEVAKALEVRALSLQKGPPGVNFAARYQKAADILRQTPTAGLSLVLQRRAVIVLFSSLHEGNRTERREELLRSLWDSKWADSRKSLPPSRRRITAEATRALSDAPVREANEMLDMYFGADRPSSALQALEAVTKSDPSVNWEKPADALVKAFKDVHDSLWHVLDTGPSKRGPAPPRPSGQNLELFSTGDKREDLFGLIGGSVAAGTIAVGFSAWDWRMKLLSSVVMSLAWLRIDFLIHKENSVVSRARRVLSAA